jgi:hypothetical protein
MEFSYRISEDDYVQGIKMARKLARKSIGKVIAFWAFIVVCLVLLFGVIAKSNHHDGTVTIEPSSSSAAQVSTTDSLTKLAVNWGPVVLVLAFWVFWIPYQTRRAYRKDTNAHGEFTMTLDLQSVALRSTSGMSWQSGWNAFKGWREDKGILLLQYPSKTSQLVNIKTLSDPEREELKNILTAALPKK